MARHQGEDGGKHLPAMESSWEYVEQAAADNRQGVVLRLGVGRGDHNLSQKQIALLQNI
jgi:hypothetical protein